MKVPLEKMMGKEIKAVIMETFQEYLLSKTEMKDETKEEDDDEEVVETKVKNESKPKKLKESDKPRGDDKIETIMETKIDSKAKLIKEKPKVSAKAAQIERLKSYVFKCGVRKVW